MRKIITTILSAFMLLSTEAVSAQNTMRVHLEDGKVAEYSISSIKHIDWYEKEETENEPAYELIEIDGKTYQLGVSGAIDLGLSVKWATCNVGATSPGEYGDYYAWGETEIKSNYSWSTLKYCEGTTYYGPFTKYVTNSSYGTVDNKTVLDPEDDVAHVKRGDNWRIPTKAEQDELRTKCAWIRTQYGSHKGYVVVGSTGNAIFLPAAGCRYDTNLNNVGSLGYYWLSSLYEGGSNYAYSMHLGSSSVGWYNYGRNYGFSVRPVYP